VECGTTLAHHAELLLQACFAFSHWAHDDPLALFSDGFIIKVGKG
jgi:hypothetical protein